MRRSTFLAARAALAALALGAMGACPACAGCETSKATPIAAAPEPSSSAPDASAHDASAQDASGSGVLASSAMVDLLQDVPAQIAVSSSVRNPRDKPAHLVDGDTKTAWNGKTGDLAGGWIGFRVPEDATVDHVEIVVGFDRTKDGLDLFAANHRIKRVAVRRLPSYANGCREMAGTVRPEEIVALDPDRRGFQELPVHQPGGVICLWVVETVPGSRADWRELVVSEMRAMGRPGKARRDVRHPVDVSDGSLLAPYVVEDTPGLRATFKEGGDSELSASDVDELTDQPYRTLDRLCAAYVRTWRRFAKEAATSPYPPVPSTIACREIKLPVAFTGAAPPFVGARAIEGKTGWTKRGILVGETKEGFWLTPIVFSEDIYTEDDSREQWQRQAIEELRVDNGNLVLVQDWLHVSSSPLEYRVEPALARGAAWCRVSSGRLLCKQWHPTFAAPLAMKRKDGERDPAVVSGLPWSDEVPFVVDASGTLHKR